jgi:hypothetical protein
MTCKAIREGDEMACVCGLRWGVDEDRPLCPNERPPGELPEATTSHTPPDKNISKKALETLHHIVEDKES